MSPVAVLDGPQQSLGVPSDLWWSLAVPSGPQQPLGSPAVPGGSW